MSRVEAAATPFVGRDVRFIMNVHGRWAGPPRRRGSAPVGARSFNYDAARHRQRGYVNS